jgi:hypothetical protein
MSAELIKNNRENIIKLLVTIIVLSVVGFIFGLFNYITINLNDPYIPSNGGGDVMGTITSITRVQSYGEYYRDGSKSTKYSLDFNVSYNINNKLYTKNLTVSNITDPNNTIYKLNSKLDLLYDRNNNIIIKSKKHDKSYEKMMNDFYSVTLMRLSSVIFIIFSIVYFLFTKYIKF